MPTAGQKKKAEDAARSEQAKKNAKLKPREFEETTIQGDDGGREINHRKTNVEFKNLGVENVKIDLANCGLEHCIQNPDDLTEEEKPYDSMLDVVRNYLIRSFTGTIGSGVVKSYARDVQPFVLWTALTTAYEQEDEYTSKAELEYVYDQYPLLRQLLMRKAGNIETLFRVEPETGNHIPMTDDSRFDNWMQMLVTEYRAWKILEAEEDPKQRMEQVDINRLPDVEKLNEAILKHPTIVGLPYITPNILEELQENCKQAFPEDPNAISRPYKIEDKIANPEWEFSTAATIAAKHLAYRKHQKMLNEGAKETLKPSTDRIAGTKENRYKSDKFVSWKDRQGDHQRKDQERFRKDPSLRVRKGECPDYMTGGNDGKGCANNAEYCCRRLFHPRGRFNTVAYKSRESLQKEYEKRISTRQPGNRFGSTNYTRYPRQEGRKRANPDIECFNCGKKGHPAFKCQQSKKGNFGATYDKAQMTEAVVAGVKAALKEERKKPTKAKAKRRRSVESDFDESILDYDESDDETPAKSAKKAKKTSIGAVKSLGMYPHRHVGNVLAVMMLILSLHGAGDVMQPTSKSGCNMHDQVGWADDNITMATSWAEATERQLNEQPNHPKTPNPIVQITLNLITTLTGLAIGLIMSTKRRLPPRRRQTKVKPTGKTSLDGHKVYASSKRKYSNIHIVSPRARSQNVVWRSPLIWRNQEGWELRQVGESVTAKQNRHRKSVRDRLIATLHERKRKARDAVRDQPDHDLPVFDSGANIHGTGNVKHFHTLRFFATPRILNGAGGTTHQVLGIGSVKFKTKDADGFECVVEFDGVRYAPDLTALYIDTTALRNQHDWKVEGEKGHITWITPKGVRLPLLVVDGLEYLDGTYLSRTETANHRVNGFVSKAFRERVEEMSDTELTDEVDKGDLNRWQDHHVRLHLAKGGTLVVAKDAPSEWLRVHHLLGHPPARVTSAHCRKYGIPLSQVENRFCESCLAAGQTKKPRGKKRKVNTRPKPLTKFSCDVWGPTKQKSGKEGARWILMYIDHATDECFSYPLAHLRNIPARTAEFLADVRKGRREAGEVDVELPTTMHSDSASYFRSAAMAQVARQMNTSLTFSPPETQNKNGKIERYFGLIGKRALALLVAAGLPESDWLYAWLYANQLHTRTVRNGDTGATSPFEKRYGHAPGDVTKTHLPFGARCSVWQPKAQRDGKLGKRARLGIVIGYDDQTQAPIVRITTKTGRKVLRVTSQWRLDPRLPPGVYENAGPLLPDLKGEDEEEELNPIIEKQPDEERDTKEEKRARFAQTSTYVPPQDLLGDPQGDEEEVAQAEQMADEDMELHEPEMEAEEEEEPQKRDTIEVLPGTGYRLVAGIKAVVTWGKGMAAETSEVQHARTKGTAYSLKTAIRIWPGYEKELRKAAQVEVDGLRKMCLEPIPQHEFTAHDRAHVSTLSTIYSLKWEGDHFSKGKMRAVFRGEKEVKDEDYIQSSSTVPRLSSIRAFLALTPRRGVRWGAMRMDVSQAYLRADLEPIPRNKRRVVGLPADVTPRWPDGEPIRFKLTHSIYGMHSAGWMWAEKLSTYLTHLGFTRNKHEPNLWRKGDLHVIVYVDDLGVRGPQDKMNWFQRCMEREFGNVKPNPLDFLLGMQIVSNPETGSLGVHSASYIDGMVAVEGLEGLKDRQVPLPPGTRIDSTQRTTEPDTKTRQAYQRLLGQVSYLAAWTHPDLSYPVSALASVASAPTMNHLKLLKRTVGYLKKTGRSLGLKWNSENEISKMNSKICAEHREKPGGQNKASKVNPPPVQWEPNVLQVWTDASWAQEDESCSQSGFVAMMNGGPVHWYSKRQEFAALSSTEAEIMAAVTALRYTLHMKAMLEEMGFPQGAVKIHVDAANAIRFCTEEKITKRNHHIGVRYHRMRHHIKVADVEVVFCRTADMLADTATKNAAEVQFKGVIDAVMNDFGTDACRIETTAE